jgi:hypothetical protein
LVNKHPSATIPVQTNIVGSVNKATIKLWRYGISQDEAARTGVGTQDVTTQSLTNLAPNFAYDLKPYSVVILSYAKK